MLRTSGKCWPLRCETHGTVRKGGATIFEIRSQCSTAKLNQNVTDPLVLKSEALQSQLALPWRGRGRPAPKADAEYQRQLKRWCAKVLKINSTLDFKVSSRGWCYILEEHGLAKGDFDDAQKLINDCRKSGLLPLNICAEDEGRQAEHLEKIDNQTPKEFAEEWIDYVRNSAHEQFTPISFWDDLDFYLEMTVEKVDLKSLFSPECEEFHVALSNISGWNDINSCAAIMRRFKYWESRDKKCVLLHCGDHDPGGYNISEFLRKNFADLSDAVGWSPDNLIIDRFGLNADFIRRHRLTWIDNLITGSGGNPLQRQATPGSLQALRAGLFEATSVRVRWKPMR